MFSRLFPRLRNPLGNTITSIANNLGLATNTGNAGWKWSKNSLPNISLRKNQSNSFRQDLSHRRRELLIQLGNALASCNDDNVSAIRSELKAIQKELKRMKRQQAACRQASLEADLEEALRCNQNADAQRLSRLIAGTNLGVRKRRTNTLCCYKPSRQELVDTATMDAHLGGLGAIEVDWEDTQAEWIEEPLDYNQSLIGLVQDEIDAIDKAVKEDLKCLRRAFCQG